jgi:hypothetical protein
MQAALRTALSEASLGRPHDDNSAAQRQLRAECERAAQEAASRSARGEQPGVGPADRIPEALARRVLGLAFAAPPATNHAFCAGFLAARIAAVLASVAPPAALPPALTPGAVAAAAIGRLEDAWGQHCSGGGDARRSSMAWVSAQVDAVVLLLQGRNPLPAGALARLARPRAALAVLRLAELPVCDPHMRMWAFSLLKDAFGEWPAAGGTGSGAAGAGRAALEAAWGDDDLDAASRHLAAQLVAPLREAAEPGAAAQAPVPEHAAATQACAAALAACNRLPPGPAAGARRWLRHGAGGRRQRRRVVRPRRCAGGGAARVSRGGRCRCLAATSDRRAAATRGCCGMPRTPVRESHAAAGGAATQWQ